MMSGTLGIPVLIAPNDTWSVMWSEYCLLPIHIKGWVNDGVCGHEETHSKGDILGLEPQCLH